MPAPQDSLTDLPPQSSRRSCFMEFLRLAIITGGAVASARYGLLSSRELMAILIALALPTDLAAAGLRRIVKKET